MVWYRRPLGPPLPNIKMLLFIITAQAFEIVPTHTRISFESYRHIAFKNRKVQRKVDVLVLFF